ncbi:MAG: hypothetical protein AAFZ49_12785 [Cyanobacteria bacterium J06659_2]
MMTHLPSFSELARQVHLNERKLKQGLTRRYALEISPEALTDLDGDFIFLIYDSHFSGGIR